MVSRERVVGDKVREFRGPEDLVVIFIFTSVKREVTEGF